LELELEPELASLELDPNASHRCCRRHCLAMGKATTMALRDSTLETESEPD
jgi:hypothetical protein